jgi:predicted PurR-regulated permease PerM
VKKRWRPVDGGVFEEVLFMSTEKIESVSRADGGALITKLASFVILIAGLKAASTLVVPVLLSVFIAIISAPALFWLVGKRVPKALAFLVVAAVVVVVLALFGMVISSSASDFIHRIPEYQEQLRGVTMKVAEFAKERGIPLSTSKMLEYIDPSMALGLTGKMLGGIGGLLSSAFLIFLTVGFMMFEASSFPRKLAAVSFDMSDENQPISKFLENVKKYLAIKTATSFSTGLIVFLCLDFFGLDYPLLWGLLAFALNFIPSIGSIIAAVPPILLALVQLDWKSALGIAVMYVVVNSVIGNVIEPKYMGKGLGLSPLVVFLSLLFWGWVLGPVGMFLSVPLTMTAKIACDSFEDTKWIGVFLGP